MNLPNKPTKKTRITVDTNVMGEEKISQIEHTIKGKSFEIASTTVSDREIEGSTIKPLSIRISETGVWDESSWDKAVWGGSILELGIVGESRVGSAIVASQESADMLENILKIISSSGFPKPGQRENLTRGQRHQLRDAMILEAHWREKRNIFISNDTRAFGKPRSDLRKKLEHLCSTSIMTYEEFCDWVKAHK